MKVRINNEPVEYEVSLKDNSYMLFLQDSISFFQVFKCGNDFYIIDTDKNVVKIADFYKTKNKTIIWIEDEEFVIEEITENEMGLEQEVVEKDIKSPMPGIIREIKFSENDVVKKGDVVVVLESMKVLNELRSSVNGRIKKIHCNVGDQVGPFELLVEIEPEEDLGE